MNDLKEGSLIDLIEFYAKTMEISLYDSVQVIYESLQDTGLTISMGHVVVRAAPLQSQTPAQHKQVLEDILKKADHLYENEGVSKEDTIANIIKEAKEQC